MYNEKEDSSLSSSSVFSECVENEGGSDYSLEKAHVPLETVAGMVVVLVLDENHYIRKMDIEYRCISETPILSR